MTDRLSLYNGALTVLGERRLASLTENRTSRHKLDDVWDNNLVKRVLQHGQWNFAARSVKLEASLSVTPAFGYQFAYDKPIDFIRTMQVGHDEYFEQPITRYSDEAKFIFTDEDEIYFQYVSSDSQWGLDFSLWPENFTEYVEHYIAYKVAPRLIGLDISNKELGADMKRMLAEAKSSDAMESPAKFAPQGGWARSRAGYRAGSGDRGRRSQLIG
jgi:hypothetical protein